MRPLEAEVVEGTDAHTNHHPLDLSRDARECQPGLTQSASFYGVSLGSRSVGEPYAPGAA